MCCCRRRWAVQRPSVGPCTEITERRRNHRKLLKIRCCAGISCGFRGAGVIIQSAHSKRRLGAANAEVTHTLSLPERILSDGRSVFNRTRPRNLICCLFGFQSCLLPVNAWKCEDVLARGQIRRHTLVVSSSSQYWIQRQLLVPH